MDRVRIEHHGAAGGMLWFGGWIFTIGYLQLPFWKAVAALIVWPYYLGLAARAVGA
jgi:hypothetical protein